MSKFVSKQNSDWVATGWGSEQADCVVVRKILKPGYLLAALIHHEDDIDERCADIPLDLRAEVLREVRANRPCGKNEARSEDGDLWAFRFNESGEFEWNRGVWMEPGCLLSGRGDILDPVRIAAQAWIAKNRPLAGDETVSTSGKRGVMSIEECPFRHDAQRLVVTWSDGEVSKYERSLLNARGSDWERRRVFYWAEMAKAKDSKPEPIDYGDSVFFFIRGGEETIWDRRWHDGKKQLRKLDGEKWGEWEDYVLRFCFISGEEKRFDSWFDANKPKPQAGPINDDDSNAIGWRFSGGSESHFKLDNNGNAVLVGESGERCLTTSDDGWSSALLAFRDRERAKWKFECNGRGVWVTSPSGVHGYVNLSGDGALLRSFPTWVRNKARELFRANWQLAPDEIWMGGEIVKLEMSSGNDAVLFKGRWWDKWCGREGWMGHPSWGWLSESERLEAFDRCRAFYESKRPVLSAPLVRLAWMDRDAEGESVLCFKAGPGDMRRLTKGKLYRLVEEKDDLRRYNGDVDG